MESRQKAMGDLQYVKHALEREGATPIPAAIALLWAAITLVGFAIIDLRPQQAWMYWGIAGPGGFLVSMWLGMRHSLAAGTDDRAEGLRWGAHWLALLVAIGLAGVGVARGVATYDSFGATVLLLIALAYLMAGIHLARALLLVAAVLAAGYVALLFVQGHVWLWLGVLAALAMAATPYLGASGRVERQ